MPDKSNISDLGGVLAVLGSLGSVAWNVFTKDPINYSIVILTGVGGIIYIIYKVINEKKKSRLLDLQIKEKLSNG